MVRLEAASAELHNLVRILSRPKPGGDLTSHCRFTGARLRRRLTDVRSRTEGVPAGVEIHGA